MIKPRTTWTGFLSSAPYFTGAIMDAMDQEAIADYPDLVRAVIYYDIFDGEVSNGGVMQYFFNQAFRLPDFEAAAEVAAKHPALREGAAFMAEAHASWQKVRPSVETARESEDWPEDLFGDDAFEDLEQRFFDANHAIRMGLYAAIVSTPSDYLEILPEARDAQYRFEDEFPVGPNVVESRRGTSVVWFTPDRKHVEVERGGFFDDGSRSRDWVDFTTGMSGSRQFEEGRLVSTATEKALWTQHGILERYGPSGDIEHTSLALDGKELISVHGDGLILADKKALTALLKSAKDLGRGA